ncbi:MAG: hypothetical protein OXF84_06715 [Bacteroidetes bacterium]|nr:hypothetical protein [Bacteroidota bacterium]
MFNSLAEVDTPILIINPLIGTDFFDIADVLGELHAVLNRLYLFATGYLFDCGG